MTEKNNCICHCEASFFCHCETCWKYVVAITSTYTHTLYLCLCIRILVFVFRIYTPAVNSSPIFFSSLRGAKRRGNLILYYPQSLSLYFVFVFVPFVFLRQQWIATNNQQTLVKIISQTKRAGKIALISQPFSHSFFNNSKKPSHKKMLKDRPLTCF